jgi:hypothetical protein
METTQATLENSYETRKTAKIEKYREIADRKRGEATATLDRARSMADAIPLGQPILVGHHSEQRDRNYRNRIQSTYSKGLELDKTAQYYEEKAARLENGRAISSDDPGAVRKLQDKLTNLENLHDQMVRANKIVLSRRKGYSEDERVRDLVAAGFAEELARKFFVPDFGGRLGVPGYALTNSNAEIRRLKQRITTLERAAADGTAEQQIGEVRIVDSVEDNRLQAFFPGKPSEETRAALKRAGFRWSPSNGCWQSYRGERYSVALQGILQGAQQ